MKHIFHTAVHIETALKELMEGRNIFEPAPPQRAMKALTDARQEGKRYYTGCDKMGQNGRCRGHAVYE